MINRIALFRNTIVGWLSWKRKKYWIFTDECRIRIGAKQAHFSWTRDAISLHLTNRRIFGMPLTCHRDLV